MAESILCPCCGSTYTNVMIDDLTKYKIITCLCCGEIDMVSDNTDKTKGN